MRGIRPTRTLIVAGLVGLVSWALGSGPTAPVAALTAPDSTAASSTTSTSTTTAPSGSPLGVVPTTGAAPTSTTTTVTPGSSAPGPSGGSTTTTTGSGPTTTVPPSAAMAAEEASVRRTGPSSTGPLIAALAPLGKLGLSPEQIAILGFGQFPVAGPASYSDIFLEYRSWPEPHVHQGIDIQAPEGTPLRSPADGTLTYSDSDPNGYGLSALVTQHDGTVYLLAHMSATVLGLDSGARVSQGQVIGFVGSTGDSTGPHLDFEIHPHGGAAIDAKPILDEYIAAAIASAPSLIARYEGTSGQAEPAEVPLPEAGPALVPIRRPHRVGPGRATAVVSRGVGGSARDAAGSAAALMLGGVAWAARRSRRRESGTGSDS